jgi:hypothetical protein
MPKPVLLYSSDPFNRQELITFLSSIHIEGAKIFTEKPYPGYPYDVRVTREDQFVNIAYEDQLTEEEDEEAALEPIKQALGAEPKTCVLLDISKYDPRSQLLGLEIASMLLDHWPGIIDVLREVEHPYLTRNDILDLYEKGYGFLGRPLFPSAKVSKPRPIAEMLEERAETGQTSQRKGLLE